MNIIDNILNERNQIHKFMYHIFHSYDILKSANIDLQFQKAKQLPLWKNMKGPYGVMYMLHTE